jgi:hypothetical protein
MGVKTMDLMAQGRWQGTMGLDLIFCGYGRLYTLDCVYLDITLEGLSWENGKKEWQLIAVVAILEMFEVF